MSAPTPGQYTPTTDEIRKATKPGSYRSWGPGTAYFDRWLAQHDAEVREGVAQAIEAKAAGPDAADDGYWFDAMETAARIAREVTHV